MSEPLAQRTYILERLEKAKGRTLTRSALFKAKTAMAKLELDEVKAAEVVAQLVHDGHVEERKGKKSPSYHLTDVGEAYLKSLAPPESEELFNYRRAYLLLQLIPSDGGPIERSKANKFSKAIREDLELNVAVAARIRSALAAAGQIAIKNAGRKEWLELTPAGKAELAALDQHPAIAFSLKGVSLNALLASARTSALATKANLNSAAPADGKNPSRDDLSEAAYAEFQELRREKYSHTKVVPIFEVRRRIAGRFGEKSARHDVLDEAILELWRRGRVRISPISDMRDATEDQLADSINDPYQTLFYMEQVDGHGSAQ